MVDATQKEITDEEYEEILNDSYPTVSICGHEYDAGHALRMIDETAFNCGKNDYEATLPYVCGDCGAEFDDEEDAEECCAEEQEEAGV
jgi:hypothetical protein